MQIIELRGDENIAVIRNLLEQAEGPDVALVVPPGCEALENNQIHLAVLRRWADALALRLVLVLDDSATEVLARDIGLLVATSVDKARAMDLDAAYRRRRTGGQSLLATFRSRPSLTVSNSWLGRLPDVVRFPFVLGIAGVALSAVLVLIVPSARVTISPVSRPLSTAMDITAVNGLKAVDHASAKVPARTVTVQTQGADTIVTTSKQDVPDGHAQGSVVFANKTSNAVQIPKGTVVSTSFGRNERFYTVADVSLPAQVHSTVRVGVLAAEPGPSGNAAALTINTVEGELAAQIGVLNDSRTEGGSVRRVSAVDAQDRDQLRARLLESMQQEAYKQLTAELAADEFVPSSSLSVSVLGEQTDRKVGEVAETLGMTMTVQVKGLAVSGAGAQQLLIRELEKQLARNHRLVTRSMHFVRGDIVQATADEARFSMSVEAEMAPDVDSWSVRRTVAGKPVEEARELLIKQYSLQREPRIETQACFLGRLPWLVTRITVINQAE